MIGRSTAWVTSPITELPVTSKTSAKPSVNSRPREKSVDKGASTSHIQDFFRRDARLSSFPWSRFDLLTDDSPIPGGAHPRRPHLAHYDDSTLAGSQADHSQPAIAYQRYIQARASAWSWAPTNGRDGPACLPHRHCA